MTFVETLEPQALWQHFDQILTIPHGSGNEAALREHIIEIAKRNGLKYHVDGVGFEPIMFEIIGGIHLEAKRILQNI